MRWDAVVHSMNGDRGILKLEFEQSLIQVPLECLPKGCRVGDVLEVNISFNPFKTLERAKKAEKEK